MTPSSARVWTVWVSASSRNYHVRPDDHAGEQVSQHDRLFEPLEYDRRYRCRAQHDRQRLQKV